MANLKLIGNLITLPDTSTLSMASSVDLTWLQNQEASGLKQWLIDCTLSGTERLVWHTATQILICTYKLSTTNNTLQLLGIFISRNPWHPFCGTLWFHRMQFEKHCCNVMHWSQYIPIQRFYFYIKSIKQIASFTVCIHVHINIHRTY